MLILEKIRQKVLSGKYIFRLHIYDKLEEINTIYGLKLTTDDIEEVILNGELVDILDNDRRGKRYIINGIAINRQTELEVVCRIENNLVIITVYVPHF